MFYAKKAKTLEDTFEIEQEFYNVIIEDFDSITSLKSKKLTRADWENLIDLIESHNQFKSSKLDHLLVFGALLTISISIALVSWKLLGVQNLIIFGTLAVFAFKTAVERSHLAKEFGADAEIARIIKWYLREKHFEPKKYNQGKMP